MDQQKQTIPQPFLIMSQEGEVPADINRFQVVQTIESRQFQIVDPKVLKKKFEHLIPTLINVPAQKKREKATNIPKFILKVFHNNLPSLPIRHEVRLRKFLESLPKNKTRFDLQTLFGRSTNKEIDQQNRLNRTILKRLLNRNYDNILRNNHICNKRMYLQFCKKISLRLSNPSVMDRLEV